MKNDIPMNTGMDTLTDMLRLLSTSRDLEENLNAVLGCVSGYFVSSRVCMYMKKFSDRKAFNLKCIGMYESARAKVENVPGPKDQLPSNVISDMQWATLESHKLISLKLNSFYNTIKDENCIAFPIFFGANIFGFVVIAKTDSNIRHIDMKFIENFSRIFELFIFKLNGEKRLEDFLDFVPHPILMVDSSGVITGWSNASEEMTGWKKSDLIGRGDYIQGLAYYGVRRPTIPDLILKPDPTWEATYPEFRREGDKVYSLSYCPAVVGGGAYLRTKTSLLYDLNGRVSGDIHMVEDMTRELKMEENLHRSESMYRAITDFAGVGIMVMTKNELIYHNEHFADLLMDFGPEGMTSIEKLRLWVSSEDRDKVFGCFADLLDNSEGVARFEFSAGQGSSVRYYKGYAQPMKYEGIPAIHLIVDDITLQRELAQKARLNELRMHHEDRLTALGIMAAGIAHELNQPLNHIRMIADGILMGKENDWTFTSGEIEKGLDMISRQVVRMSQIVKNIRDFSKKDRSQEPGNIPLNSAVENVFCLIGRQLEAHGIQVQKILDPNAPTMRMAHNRLEQVIVNLLVNARQALVQSGNGEKLLQVKTGSRGRESFVEVVDNGMGVPEELKSRIFEPFFTTKEPDDGTGLGLSIVKSIMEEYQGRVELHDNNLGGATFTVVGIKGGSD